MNSNWNATEFSNSKNILEQRVYTSKLLGNDHSLVLHGGGNTSVKIEQTNIFGDNEQVLYVKGSGWDLASIEKPGFSPLPNDYLIQLASLSELSDEEMVRQLKSQLLNPSSPNPSVEAILHAILPYNFVDHTHADAIVSITNTETGCERIEQIYGGEVLIIPYVMPGFDLAKACVKALSEAKNDDYIGMVLMNHGIFSFADTAKESYQRMIYLVDKAEQYLQSKQCWQIPQNIIKKTIPNPLNLAKLRHEVCNIIGQSIIVTNDQSNETLSFVNRSDLAKISQQGPATPDHVIRTKRLPMLFELKNFNETLESYCQEYDAYFDRNQQDHTQLDKAPRVLLDKQYGLFSIGRNTKETGIIQDIYQHTMQIIQRAEMLGGFKALPEKDIFDVEYWSLEQAKLKSSKSDNRELLGDVALVTGAASGIGKACVEQLLAQGANVIAFDMNETVCELFQGQSYRGFQIDLSNQSELNQVFDLAMSEFGGLDIMILNAGIFPRASTVAQMEMNLWRKVMAVNTDANMQLLKLAHPYLKLAYNGGRVAVIGSKNVPAPGPGASAYSASKAALNQLIRVTALEWAQDNIRLNSVHPNSVFDTAIWTDEVLAQRAAHYGMNIEQYKKNNLLQTEITSQDVAQLAVAMCMKLFSKTTAAQVPIDGGNERVI